MNISLIIEGLQRILAQQGDVHGEVKLQFGQSHAVGRIVDIRFRTDVLFSKPFVQLIAQEK